MSKIKKKHVENLDEIVFENRNKEYGAYELRKKYDKNVIKALSISFSVILIITITPLIMAFNNHEDFNFVNDGGIIFDPITNPKDDPPPPPPPIEEEKLEEKKAIYVSPIISDSVPPEIEIATNETMIETGNTEEPTLEIVESEAEIEDIDIPIEPCFIKELPKFPGGDEALFLWLSENTKFPKEGRELGISGIVHIKFVINKVGKVTNIEVEKGVNEYLDKEALRVISEMPDWSPGRNNGIAVSVNYRLPIRFTLIE